MTERSAECAQSEKGERGQCANRSWPDDQRPHPCNPAPVGFLTGQALLSRFPTIFVIGPDASWTFAIDT